MTDHITEKKVESEGKVFNKNRGKTVSKSKVFGFGSRYARMIDFIDDFLLVHQDGEGTIKGKYTLTITKHLD